MYTYVKALIATHNRAN